MIDEVVNRTCPIWKIKQIENCGILFSNKNMRHSVTPIKGYSHGEATVYVNPYTGSKSIKASLYVHRTFLSFLVDTWWDR